MIHSPSTVKQVGMIAELVAKHHGIDCEDYKDGIAELTCYADNDDLLQYALDIFQSYGLTCEKSTSNVGERGHYFYVILDQSLTEESHASTTTGSDR